MKVRIFSTAICPYCDMAKDFLKKNKVEFEEIKVDKDKKGLEEMMKLSKQTGVPVLEIGKEVIVGFDTAKLKKALKLK